MFIQVVRGETSNPAGMKAAIDKWQTEVKPGAKGWLGSTGGVAKDGTFVAVVRFESEAAAQANSDRPEQGAWFEKELSPTLDGTPTFYNCNDVTEMMGGGSDKAGFVQLMIYKPTDLKKMKELTSKFESMDMGRPDVLGGTSAISSDGTVIDTNYFTSEAEAREAEKKGFPEEVQAVMAEFGEIAGETEFIDLSDPWLHSA